jgi:hypothetical protein
LLSHILWVIGMAKLDQPMTILICENGQMRMENLSNQKQGNVFSIQSSDRDISKAFHFRFLRVSTKI